MLYKNLNNRSLGQLVQYSSVAIGKIVNGKNEPKFRLIETLLNIFPEINAKWLTTGHGTMLSPDIIEIKPETELDNTLDNLIKSKIEDKLNIRFTDLEMELRELIILQVNQYLKNKEEK